MKTLILIIILITLSGCSKNAWLVKDYQKPNNSYIDYNKGSVFKDTIQRDNVK